MSEEKKRKNASLSKKLYPIIKNEAPAGLFS